jgi:hypothetical protein
MFFVNLSLPIWTADEKKVGWWVCKSEEDSIESLNWSLTTHSPIECIIYSGYVWFPLLGPSGLLWSYGFLIQKIFNLKYLNRVISHLRFILLPYCDNVTLTGLYLKEELQRNTSRKRRERRLTFPVYLRESVQLPKPTKINITHIEHWLQLHGSMTDTCQFRPTRLITFLAGKETQWGVHEEPTVSPSSSCTS